ncbi:MULTISPECIES: homoserine kinase [unclassified Desulfovibrio]|uniref:homoserine kinase n=1 Tax=unclassified Desulfovibrio TaxID=2593640 RepID=UPI000F5F93A3|nr:MULTISPECIES: homoserine kinase [unclassified Desulfovibrio]RRD71769.1 shikimate kinase [Desulfovibrio sp. OH1209_COT-279]RRD87982.1 shikimate kinase [Desulfovibrio sp. OH1186_COT-070]
MCTANAAPAKTVPCISLIGMAGAGKSTVGKVLARKLGWAFVDSDHLIEAVYAARLQDITDALGKSAFLDVECTVVTAVRARRTVIATGGSVVYRHEAMAHLASLGPVVHIEVPFRIIEERVARNPERGIAMNPGETLQELFAEREALYARYASLRCPAEGKSPAQCAHWIWNKLRRSL